MYNIVKRDEWSVRDFAMLGVGDIAYVKPVIDDGNTVFAVHAADGSEIALVKADRDVAFAAVRQHDLAPLSVH